MQLRDATADDLDRVLQIRLQSFPPHPGDPDQWRTEALEFADAGRYLVVDVGGTPVGAGRIWDFHQWWHGRPVSTAGIASVVVSPEARGRGVARTLMRGVMERSLELGHVVTSLYPATVSLYRGLGFEYAGVRQRCTFSAERLRTIRRSDNDVRPATPDDAPRLRELVAQVREGGRDSGPIRWQERYVREWLAEEGTFAYLADDGFVVYGWKGRDLLVEELVAATPATTATLLAVVGSGASVAERAHLYAGPNDPVHHLIGEEAAHDTRVERWMLRLLDAPAAIAARGWPRPVTVDTTLTIDDPDCPANAGTWRLVVKGGEGSLSAADAGRDVLSLGPRGLAALYAGTPMTALRRAGLATGDPSQDEALDAAFATAPPFCLDYF